MQANMATYQRFQTEHINVLENDRTLFDWASKQTYIALANMMTGAALIGIDSCPIEGFNYAEVNRILAQTGAYDAEKYAVSVAVTFGYRAKDIRPKSRHAPTSCATPNSAPPSSMTAACASPLSNT